MFVLSFFGLVTKEEAPTFLPIKKARNHWCSADAFTLTKHLTHSVTPFSPSSLISLPRAECYSKYGLWISNINTIREFLKKQIHRPHPRPICFNKFSGNFVTQAWQALEQCSGSQTYLHIGITWELKKLLMLWTYPQWFISFI